MNNLRESDVYVVVESLSLVKILNKGVIVMIKGTGASIIPITLEIKQDDDFIFTHNKKDGAEMWESWKRVQENNVMKFDIKN